jgi:hypothetical protein
LSSKKTLSDDNRRESAASSSAGSMKSADIMAFWPSRAPKTAASSAEFGLLEQMVDRGVDAGSALL